MNQQRKPRYGDRRIAQVDGWNGRGRPRGKSGEFTVELTRGVPGDEVEIEVLGRRRDELRARPLAWLGVSPSRVAPRCAHFAACGGCSFQDCDYATQLVHKARGLERALRLAGLDTTAVELHPVAPAPAAFGYRSKMDFTFADRRWIAKDEPADAPAAFALGLHPRDFHGKVIDVGWCEIQFSRGNGIVAAVRELSLAHGFEPWSNVAHTGFARHLVLRESRATGEILVNLVTSTEARERMEPFVRELVARVPAITTFVQNLHSKPAQAALSEREIVHHGPGFVRERLGRIEFRLSANSFFQTNVAQAEALLATVVEELAPTPDDRLHDLYCGTGAFALNLAHRVRAVVGFELVASAVDDARATAVANGVANARFVAGDLALAPMGDAAEPPTAAIADPPRAGLHPKTLAALIASGPRRIVYIACHAPSGARDAAALVAAGWRLARVRPLDFFPHTPHLETVFTFERPT
ncbi:MAG: 23S rRNA (uracil(1939)-C(5))-methyltransferase RlmD [Planctomycetes bacterium]|nr:23S rRNA (uracil(1939)-C(5))-methyltransferase RlmD [Planctomycetota bacterium]